MEILFLESVDSTHTYLKNHIKNNGYKKPLCIASDFQTKGIGSRDNSWEGEKGNLFFSFVINKNYLSSDLPVQSYSIYFSFILKELLEVLGSDVWLKWPNDFYIKDKKVGGTITNLNGELVYCGIGLNLKFTNTKYGYLDIEIDSNRLLQEYFKILNEKKPWKRIFSKYLIEFKKSKQFKTTIDGEKISLSEAILNDDGSIIINNKKVFSLR